MGEERETRDPLTQQPDDENFDKKRDVDEDSDIDSNKEALREPLSKEETE